jgi:hypothetical protein
MMMMIILGLGNEVCYLTTLSPYRRYWVYDKIINECWAVRGMRSSWRWRWRQKCFPKHWYMIIRLCSVTIPKTPILILDLFNEAFKSSDYTCIMRCITGNDTQVKWSWPRLWGCLCRFLEGPMNAANELSEDSRSLEPSQYKTGVLLPIRSNVLLKK